MMENFQAFVEWVKKNPYKTVGVVAGFVISLLIMAIGVWKTFFVLIVMSLGFFLGKAKDEGRPISDLINRIKSFFRK